MRLLRVPYILFTDMGREAHSHAFNSAKILHRDVSAGNIILTDEGRGLLIDWEMAKKVNEVGSRRPDRTVSYLAQYSPLVFSFWIGNMAIHVCGSPSAPRQGAHIQR